uniref:hypothetical protein n=1 Tax=Paractinoplanes polyasparticus TaxID=2856853 RepID=UPI001C858DD1|nr:hypothetical protein [Actinoplanes polyasparticus]
MAGSWTASTDDLRALTAFLDGLTELSAQTGVVTCVYSGTEVEFNGTTLRINSRRDEGGPVTYVVDEYDN